MRFFFIFLGKKGKVATCFLKQKAILLAINGAQAFIYAKNMQIRYDIDNKSITFASNYGYKEDSKQHMEGGFVAHSGWRHPLLDVSRIRLQAGRRCSASQDELDLDAAVVPLWHLWPRCSEDGDGNSRWNPLGEKARSKYQHLLHLPVLCSESCNSSCGRVCHGAAY